MKEINELKEERVNKIEEMDNLIKSANESKRELNEEEVNQWENLRKEVDNIDNKIKLLSEQEELNRSIVDNADNNELNKNEKMNKKRNLAEIIESKRNLDRIEDFRITTRSQNTTTTSGAIPVSTEGLQVIGKEPLWKLMGVKYLNNLNGDIKLPYLQPIVANAVAEGDAYSNPESLGSVTLSTGRISVTDTFSKELLKAGNEEVLASMIDEMMISIDRKITAQVYSMALGDATAVTGATSITLDNIQLLEKEVDADGIYMLPRSIFFDAKSVKVDDGSGKFLFIKGLQNGVAESFDGTPAFYSSLFTGNQIVYGEPESIVVGDWGEYEITYDIYSKAPEGQVVVTVSKIANVVNRNPYGFVKSALA